MRIQNIINLLKTQKFYGVSKEVDIAKGVNELTPNVKRIIDQENRKYHGRKERLLKLRVKDNFKQVEKDFRFT
jgi:hypothetical protein